jgi:hypothetical protein
METVFLRYHETCDMSERVLSVHRLLVLYSRWAERDPSLRNPSSKDPVVYIPAYIEPHLSVCIQAMCDILKVEYEECECVDSVSCYTI